MLGRGVGGGMRFSGRFFPSSVWGAYTWKEVYLFSLFCFVVFKGNFQVQAPGGLYLERRFNGGVFALRDWGAYI